MDIKIEPQETDNEFVDIPDFVEVPTLHEIKKELLVKTEDVDYKCSVCDKDFTHELSLKIHEMLHSKTNYCFVCKKIITRHFHRHVENQHSDLICDICNKVCTVKKSLQTHLRTHTKERLFKCDICNKAYMQRGALKCHKRTTHEGVKPFLCQICRGTFTTSSSLTKHVKRMHGSGEIYECRTCSKQFTDKKERNDHEASHSSKVTKKTIFCGECHQTFKSKDCLLKHLKVKHFSNVKCIHCHKMFHKSLLDTHVQSLHKPRQCEVCNQVFYHWRELRAHCFVHKNRIKCDYCGRVFLEENIDKHLQLHREDKMKKCGICKIEYRDIDKHNLVVHKNTKFIFCQLCPMKFSTRSNKLQHMSTKHVKVLGKYQCHICGSLLSNATSLKGHFSVHVDIYPYKCPLCDMVFKYANTLKRHEARHLKYVEKPAELIYRFECEACGRKAKTELALKTHQCPLRPRTYQCKVCGTKTKDISYFRTHLVELHSPTTITEANRAEFSLKNVSILKGNEERFQCNNCRAIFKRFVTYKKHYCPGRDGAGLKCNSCSESFKTKLNLVKHMKQKHCIRKLKCQVCGFRSSSKFCMRRHYVRTHILKDSMVSDPEENGATFDNKAAEDIKVER